MSLASLINLIPLIEFSLVSSIVLLHLLRALLGIGLGGAFGLIFIFLCSALLMIPFHEIGAPWSLPFVAYIRGVTGDLSVISTMLILFTWSSWSSCRLSSATPFIIAFVSILFYPFALGFTMFDPYAWGYSSIIFVSAVIVVAFLLFFTKQSWEALMVSLAVIAWSIHWHESTNLWDYLLDPFLAVWAIVISIRWLVWGRPEPVTYSAWDIDSSVLARRKRGRMFS
jgi:hypothetical protein